MDWDLIYSLKIGAAVLGGFLSLPVVERTRKRTTVQTVSESLMSVLISVAIVEKFLLEHSAWWCGASGGIIAVMVGYSWDALRAVAPKMSLFVLKLTFKRAIAKAIGVNLPDEAFDLPKTKRLPETEQAAQADDVLSEANDLNAIEFLDEVPKLPPPRGVGRGSVQRVKGNENDE